MNKGTITISDGGKKAMINNNMLDESRKGHSRMTSDELRMLFALLYKLDDHCETFLNNDMTAMEVIHILNERGFRQS